MSWPLGDLRGWLAAVEQVDPQFVTYTSADAVRALFNSRAIVDACIPFDHLDDFAPIPEADAASLEAARQKWPWLAG